MNSREWCRVTRDQPCPICGKPDWCAFSENVVLCMRTESLRPSKGEAGGWLHARTEQSHRRRARPAGAPQRRVLRIVDQPVDFGDLADQFMAAVTPERLLTIEAQLGVSADALMTTGVGWCEQRRAWSWPMHDHDLRVVGIRLRDARTHRKYAVPGSKQGVFLAACAHHLAAASRLIVTEGPTDLCAASDLGFTGIGRPSCNGGTKQLVALTRRRHVVVVADRDAAGQRGARALISALLPTVLSVRTIEPPAPHKDLRAWLQAGADHDAVQAAIDAATAQTLRVRIVR